MKNVQDYYSFVGLLELDDATASTIPAMLAGTHKFYRTFQIPKRAGGFRKISSPYPSLALVQRKILEKVLLGFDVHSNAFAYKKKSNAVLHAACHVKNDELLILDIQDFFPSISRQMIFESLQQGGIKNEICGFISSLCSSDSGLPQGASTSPILSNIIFKNLDDRFLRLARSLNLVYSRYADDLAFSGDRIPRSLPNIVEYILKSKKFNLNKNKTKLKIAGSKKIITGVSISRKVLMAPKQFKRKLRAQIYEIEKFSENLSGISNLDPFVYERVLGRINYLLQIEPANEFALEKKRILSARHQDFLALI